MPGALVYLLANGGLLQVLQRQLGGAGAHGYTLPPRHLWKLSSPQELIRFLRGVAVQILVP